MRTLVSRPSALDTTLARLLQRFGERRDDEAFEQLVALTRGRLVRTSRRIGDAQDAEDTVQTAYHALLERGELAEDASVMGWLMTAVVRIAYRKKAHAQRRDDLARRLAHWGEPEARQGAVDGLVREEERRVLRAAVTSLPEAYRDAIVLHHLQGLAVREVAELTGVSVSTVTSRLHRARGMLRGRLAPRVRAAWMALPWAAADLLRGRTPVLVGWWSGDALVHSWSGGVMGSKGLGLGFFTLMFAGACGAVALDAALEAPADHGRADVVAGITVAGEAADAAPEDPLAEARGLVEQARPLYEEAARAEAPAAERVRARREAHDLLQAARGLFDQYLDANPAEVEQLDAEYVGMNAMLYWVRKTAATGELADPK